MPTVLPNAMNIDRARAQTPGCNRVLRFDEAEAAFACAPVLPAGTPARALRDSAA